MEVLEKVIKLEIKDSSLYKKQEEIENHKEIAGYLLSAATSNFKAAGLFWDVNCEKAGRFIMLEKDSKIL